MSFFSILYIDKLTDCTNNHEKARNQYPHWRGRWDVGFSFVVCIHFTSGVFSSKHFNKQDLNINEHRNFWRSRNITRNRNRFIIRLRGQKKSLTLRRKWRSHDWRRNIASWGILPLTFILYHLALYTARLFAQPLSIFLSVAKISSVCLSYYGK